MYIIDTVGNCPSMAMSSLSCPTSLEQWHRRLTHCSPMTIQEMANHGLVDGVDVVLFLKQITTWVSPEMYYERSFKEVLGYSSCSGIY